MADKRHALLLRFQKSKHVLDRSMLPCNIPEEWIVEIPAFLIRLLRYRTVYLLLETYGVK